MGVVREHIGDAPLPHGIHRDAVREAVGFVGTRFVKRQTIEECLTGFGKDFHLLIRENSADCRATLRRITSRIPQRSSPALLGLSA